MEKTINVITLGASGVGKTSIIKRIKDGVFDANIDPTIALDYFTIKRPYKKKNLTICLNFRDTIGQEVYQNFIPKQYIRDSHVVLLVFDNVDTLNDLNKRWFRYYKENSNIDYSRFILVGNKSDIFGDQREEIIKYGEEFSQEINAHFITCSVKSDDNMDNLERYIVTEARRFIDEEEKIQNNINNENNDEDKNKAEQSNKRISFNLEKEIKIKEQDGCFLKLC